MFIDPHSIRLLSDQCSRRTSQEEQPLIRSPRNLHVLCSHRQINSKIFKKVLALTKYMYMYFRAHTHHRSVHE